MPALLWLVLAVTQGPNPTAIKLAPAPEQVRAAVERSLPWLQKGALAWKGRTFGPDKVRCVSCHQVPFAVWALQEAKSRGFRIDQAKLDELAHWMLDFTAKKSYPDEMVDGFLDTLALVHESGPKNSKVLPTFVLFEKMLADQQLKDGSWMVWDGTNKNEPGMQVVPKKSGPEAKREATEVDTLWTILGLNALERQLTGPEGDQSRASLRQHRARALEWLKGAKGGTRNDWLAFRMLIEKEFGDARQVGVWKQALLDRQNQDGGWGLAKAEVSHPLVTGQALYALSVVGLRGDDAAVRRAWKYLLDAQQPDGSWKASSRVTPGHANHVTHHWGTGWATIGLLRTLPER